MHCLCSVAFGYWLPVSLCASCHVQYILSSKRCCGLQMLVRYTYSCNSVLFFIYDLIYQKDLSLAHVVKFSELYMQCMST